MKIKNLYKVALADLRSVVGNVSKSKVRDNPTPNVIMCAQRYHEFAYKDEDGCYVIESRFPVPSAKSEENDLNATEDEVFAAKCSIKSEDDEQKGDSVNDKEEKIVAGNHEVEPEPEKGLPDEDYIMASPKASSTPVTKKVPSRKASLTRPNPLKQSTIDALRRQDSGFATFCKSNNVIVETTNHYSEEEWQPEDTFYSEEAEKHSCGTQTTAETKSERMLR